MLPQPAAGALVGSVVSPPSNSLSWSGGPGADHYDLYRSAAPMLTGAKVNAAPLTDGGPPGYLVSVDDDGAATTSAPPVGSMQYYRLVAADAAGNYGLASDAVAAVITGTPYVQDPILATLVSALRADATLMGMLGGDPGQIRFQKRIQESGDTYPYVVAWRSSWKEDPRFKDDRHGTLEYTLSVVNNQSSSPAIVNVINRIAALLDGEPGKVIFKGSPSVMVLMCMFMGGGPESFTEQPKLWFQDATLKIVCELIPT